MFLLSHAISSALTCDTVLHEFQSQHCCPADAQHAASVVQICPRGVDDVHTRFPPRMECPEPDFFKYHEYRSEATGASCTHHYTTPAGYMSLAMQFHVMPRFAELLHTGPASMPRCGVHASAASSCLQQLRAWWQQIKALPPGPERHLREAAYHLIRMFDIVLRAEEMVAHPTRFGNCRGSYYWSGALLGDGSVRDPEDKVEYAPLPVSIHRFATQLEHVLANDTALAARWYDTHVYTGPMLERVIGNHIIATLTMAPYNGLRHEPRFSLLRARGATPATFDTPTLPLRVNSVSDHQFEGGEPPRVVARRWMEFLRTTHTRLPGAPTAACTLIGILTRRLVADLLEFAQLPCVPDMHVYTQTTRTLGDLVRNSNAAQSAMRWTAVHAEQPVDQCAAWHPGTREGWNALGTGYYGAAPLFSQGAAFTAGHYQRHARYFWQFACALSLHIETRCGLRRGPGDDRGAPIWPLTLPDHQSPYVDESRSDFCFSQAGLP